MMQDIFVNWIKKEFPQKAERIIRYALSEETIIEAGIELNDHEIFVQYPGFEDYYGSNYGRLIQIKGGEITLKAQPTDGEGYIVYLLLKRITSQTGSAKEPGEYDILPITAHRLVADLFLPNYWPDLRRNQLHTHHLDHNKLNNKWTNLLFIPSSLHYYMNKVSGIWFSDGAPFERINPYQLLRQTELKIEDVVLPLKRDADMVEIQNGRPLFIYNLGECFIGFELTEAELQKREEKK